LKKFITVEELYEDKKQLYSLELLVEAGLSNRITSADVNRPGFMFSRPEGYFPENRIQIFGKFELLTLAKLSSARRKIIYGRLLRRVPCLIITRGQKVPEELLLKANQNQTPVLRTQMRTLRFISEIILYLEDKLSPSMQVHGSLLSVYGVGVLIMGKSGVGKSECALDLIKRGHNLVADDIVEIKATYTGLTGQVVDPIGHNIEIRGLGIINIKELFGVRSVMSSSRIELVVLLEEWQKNKEYERLGLDEKTCSLLDIKIPQVSIPVRPGRNLAIIIEVAAMNHRLKQTGFHSAREFDRITAERLLR